MENNLPATFHKLSKRPINNRVSTLIIIIISLVLIMAIIFAQVLLSAENLNSNLLAINQAPSREHFFGTDWLGRDMFTRTIYGLQLSLLVGFVTSLLSLFIGTLLGLLASLNRYFDAIVLWVINLFLTIPSTIFAILISILMGRGVLGVIVSIALTHWVIFARLVRTSVQEVQAAQYLQLSYKLGKKPIWIAIHHILPHLLPLFFVGLTVLFPATILHEATLTLLGFGISPHQPAIGVILSESIKYLSSGQWWLMVFPGLSLLLLVIAIQQLGENIRRLVDPRTLRE